jgi:glucose/arabinose dehydrogenase
VVRIRFDKDGRPTKIEPFATGFLVGHDDAARGDGWANWARPYGLVVARDGAVLVGDDKNGVIYHTAYEPKQPAGGGR